MLRGKWAEVPAVSQQQHMLTQELKSMTGNRDIAALARSITRSDQFLQIAAALFFASIRKKTTFSWKRG